MTEHPPNDAVGAFGPHVNGKHLGYIQTVHMPFGCAYRWFEIEPQLGARYNLGPLRDSSTPKLMMERFFGVPIRVVFEAEIIAALSAVPWEKNHRLPENGVWCEIQVD